MANFKQHKSGFSFIEVVVALMVFALAMTALLTLQGNLSRTVRKGAEKIRIFLSMKNFFYDIEKKNSLAEKLITSEEKKIEEGMLAYSSHAPADNSQLKKLKNITLERIEFKIPKGQLKQSFVIIKPIVPEKSS